MANIEQQHGRMGRQSLLYHKQPSRRPQKLNISGSPERIFEDSRLQVLPHLRQPLLLLFHIIFSLLSFRFEALAHHSLRGQPRTTTPLPAPVRMLRALLEDEVRHLQKMREVETDSFHLAALLPLALRHDEDGLVAAEERLQEAVIGLFGAPEGGDVLEGALEGRGHLAEERPAVLYLQHPDLFQFLLVGYLQARPGQFPVEQIGQSVEEGLQIIAFPLLFQLVRADRRVSRSPHEAAHALSPAPAGFGQPIIHKIQFVALPHQVLGLEVAVHDSLGVHALHDCQQFQRHLADIALGVLLESAEVAIQQLHLHEQPASPLPAEVQLRHSPQALQFPHNIRLVPQHRLQARPAAVLNLERNNPLLLLVDRPDNGPKAALPHDLHQLILPKRRILLQAPQRYLRVLLHVRLQMETNKNQASQCSSRNLPYTFISSNNFSFSTRSYFLRLSESFLKKSELPTVKATANQERHCQRRSWRSERRKSQSGVSLLRRDSLTLKILSTSAGFLKSSSAFCVSSRCYSSFFFWKRFSLRLSWSTVLLIFPQITYILALMRSQSSDSFWLMKIFSAFQR